MKFKKNLIALCFSITVILSTNIIFANSYDFNETSTPSNELTETKTPSDELTETKTPSDELTETSNITQNLDELYDNILKFNAKSQKMKSSNNGLNLISKTDENILIGMPDLNNEKLKNDILSIAGENTELVEFVEFIPEFDYFAKEPPLRKSKANVCAVGEFATVAGNYMTVGSPVDSTLRSFYTANHGVLRVGDSANVAMIFTGTVSNVYFRSNSDVTRINILGGTINNRGITSYRGSTNNNDSVKAYTAYSGTVYGTVIYNSATVNGPAGNMNGMIIVDMATQPGDSGAALVKGSTAVGILSFGARLNGRNVTVFTCTNNI